MPLLRKGLQEPCSAVYRGILNAFVMAALLLIPFVGVVGAIPRSAGFQPSHEQAKSPSSRLIVDELKRTVTLRGIPQRIISLAPNITEILFTVGAGHRVVGASQASDFPPEAGALPRVGPFHRPSLEKIIMLRPDLVIATMDGTPRALAEELDRLGIPLYVINPTHVEGIILSIRNIGTAVGAPRTEEVARLMEKAVTCIRNAVETIPHRPKVLYQIDFNPLISAGRGTFSHSVITLAGGDNIASRLRGKYPRLSMEEVILQEPEVIIISTMKNAVGQTDPMREWRRWDQIPAVKDGRVYAVDSDLVDRPSPRCVRGIQAIARLLHPSRENDIQRCVPGK